MEHELIKDEKGFLSLHKKVEKVEPTIEKENPFFKKTKTEKIE